jgi:L-tartrate/succinate antiporter
VEAREREVVPGSVGPTPAASPAGGGGTARASRRAWRAWAPIALALLVAAAPAPAGLPRHAWLYFAVFVGVVGALVLEPLPNAAVGLVGVAVVATLSRRVLFGPEELASPGFDARVRALEWALSGFRNPAVWLAFSAFMFGLGYERTLLGPRIALWVVRAMGKSTLRLGYAVTVVDALLAPFTPSNTARSAGIVYPVIRGIPHLYRSEPDSPSARRIGSYLLWTAFAASCVTSSLFLTALAPNLIAADIVRRMVGVELGWLRWFVAAASFALPLLVALPLLGLLLCAPELRSSPEVPEWAAGELARLGPMSRREIAFALLVGGALALWILGPSVVHPATVALAVIALMLLLRVVTWEEMVGHAPAWDMLVRLALLVAMAEGLTRTGFVGWMAHAVGRQVEGLSPIAAATALVAVYYASHYLFATTTAHAIAVFPVMLGVGLAVPGLPVVAFATVLALSHGVMGVISPYATGPAPVYHGSGYLPSGLFWRLGAAFGAVFLSALLLLGLPAALALWPG